MRKAKVLEGLNCPKSGNTEKQANYGYNRLGTQLCKYNNCSHTPTQCNRNTERIQRRYDKLPSIFIIPGLAGVELGFLF